MQFHWVVGLIFVLASGYVWQWHDKQKTHHFSFRERISSGCRVKRSNTSMLLCFLRSCALLPMLAVCFRHTVCQAGYYTESKPSKVKRKSSAAANCWPFLYRPVCSIVVNSKQCWKTINKISDSWDTWPWVDPQGKKILKVGFHSEEKKYLEKSRW